MAATATLPSANVMMRAAKLGIDEDRPIMLDYFEDSVRKTCCIGVRSEVDESGTKKDIKYLVKSETEYTSTIQGIFRLEECFLVCTENSLYIIHKDVPVKRVSAPKEE